MSGCHGHDETRTMKRSSVKTEDCLVFLLLVYY